VESPQEQYAKAMRTSQEAVVGAAEAWAKSIQSAFGQPQAGPTGSVVDPNQVIDQVFDFAERMLEVQREFAKSLAGAAASAGQTAREQAESVAETTRRQARPASGSGGTQSGRAKG
jgi:hypothetical protein